MAVIRQAVESDLLQLTDIYNHYVLNSYATFDIQAQTIEEREAWFSKFKNHGPYQLVVAVEEGRILGYACSSRYRDHFAFDGTVETSIYVDQSIRARGVGTQLYTKLFEILNQKELHLAVVGIALPNEASVSLHLKFGFENVGTFKEYAVKNGQYISSLWMQKKLG
jgi:phosphinothricin acetyltransferase